MTATPLTDRGARMQHLIRSRRQASIAWLLTAGAVLCMNCWTLTLSPVIFQDEIQIVDLGRATLPDADLTWGLQWSNQGRTARAPAFLGAALQELAFRFSDAQIFGPRLSSQIGLLLASAALLGWMTTVGVSPTVAFLGSLLLLMEPTLTQGTRGGRIDGLAIFFVILACWIVSATPRQSNGVALVGLCAAGICLALSLLVWPSSLLAFPLLWIPLSARNVADGGPSPSRVAMAFAELGLLGVICAGSVAFAVACLPAHGAPELTDFRAGVSGTTSVSAAGAVSWAAGMGTLFTDLKSSPWLIPWAFCGMLFRRRWAILLPACASIAGVVATRVYFYRTVY